MSTPSLLVPLSFDLSRPFGNLDDGDRIKCTVSKKSISFSGASIIGYDCPVQLSKLDPDHTLHVLSFEMSGMVIDHGLNAIALFLIPEDAIVPDLDTDTLFLETSQTFAPFECSYITIAIDMATQTLTMFAEAPSVDAGGKKRSREDDAPLWYHPTDKTKYTEIGNMLWRKTYKVPELSDTTPRVGLTLCGGLSNVTRIIDASKTRAFAHMAYWLGTTETARAAVYG